MCLCIYRYPSIQTQGTQRAQRAGGTARPSLLPSSGSQWLPEYLLPQSFGVLPPEPDNILLGELHNIYVGLSSSSKSTCMLHTLSLPSSWCSGPLTSKLQEENYTTAGPKNTRPASPVGIRGKIRSHPDTEERTELRVHSRASGHKAEANFLGKGPVGIA